MPLERRLALLEWASRVGAWVVEDDYVSEFRYEGRPLEALQSLDRDGRAIYMGSFSKTLFPALRLAYLVLPRAAGAALPRRQVGGGSLLRHRSDQEALAEFITSGQFERYLRRAGARNAAAPAGPDRGAARSTSAAAWRSPARTPACTWWSG